MYLSNNQSEQQQQQQQSANTDLGDQIDDPTIIVPYNTEETYRSICMTLLAMVTVHKKYSDHECFQNLIGYKILFDRAGIDIHRPPWNNPQSRNGK
jgi:hypothetical protein